MENKRLDVKKILDQTGMTMEEFVQEIGITVENLLSYENGDPIPSEVLNAIVDYTGLSIAELFRGKNPFSAKPVNPKDTFSSINNSNMGLLEYLNMGREEFESEEVKECIDKVEMCAKSVRKAKISFAGRSDAGKSTLINTLLGAEEMPAKWTPTTSIVVHIKHIDDRPDFMGGDDVWIFRDDNGKEWDDAKLDEESYCRNMMVARGDFSLLDSFGTHQGGAGKDKQAKSAVAFIDSPMLKNADILDLPGFAANEEDDALHRFNTQEKETDILIFLSPSNGFLQDRDIEYLNTCIKALKPVEKKGVNQLSQLCNLFIVASQAGTVEGGNVRALTEIMDIKCEALCKTHNIGTEKSLLPNRTEETGYEYVYDDFRKRFFSYERESSRLCKKFNDDFSALLEEFPKAMEEEFKSNIKNVRDICNKSLMEKIKEWESAQEKKEEYRDLAFEMESNEPARRAEQIEKNNEMKQYIEELKTDSKSELLSEYSSIMSTENLVSLMNEKGIKNKNQERQDFCSFLNVKMSNTIENILKKNANKYNEKLDMLLRKYSDYTNKFSYDKDIDVSFNSREAFAKGLIGIGAMGASAIWLSTSVTAWTAITFGTLAGLGPIIAVGGVIGVAIAGGIAAVLSITNWLGGWKEKFAKKIIEEYDKKDFINIVNKDIDKYWEDTVTSFEIGMKKVDEEWNKRIKEYRELADENYIPILKKKIEEARRGLVFFMRMPLQEIG